eukprot:CAMPEP_0182867212 /NCGR_PEP_ID=MMETSP0034_2-20130328/8598_1 /TAXON_ID=156128 /ORGANISM="Nephroselmis pyriformis, Strain CCMP717" /LENGTH=215 /DNA_ID=CAMNT_0024999555 /DNA_START=33 /DNA_END=680 /DNA_ORIENTATION=+
MSKYIVAALAFAASASAAPVNLDGKNFDSLVLDSGKSAFVKFFAPWCGHCKALKPDWDKLGDKYKDSTSVIIGDVDCTTDDAKDLCQKFGVRGYPTLKTFAGNPQGDDYKGGRKFDDLVKHVDDNLGPQCSPDNKEVCSEEQIKFIDEKSGLDKAALDAEIEALDAEVKAAEDGLQETIKGLQATYETAMKEKDDKINDIAPKTRMLRAIAKTKA